MRSDRFFLTAVVACWLAVLWAPLDAAGETWDLQLKRLQTRGTFSQADYVYRATNSQSFSMAFQDQSTEGPARLRMAGQEERERDFKRIVKKEPQYVSKHPFRAVAKLGSQEFAFALDIAAPRAEKKATKPQPKEGKTKDQAKEAAKSDLLAALSRALAGGPREMAAGDGAARPGRAIAYTRLYFDANANGDLTDDKVIEAEPTPEMALSGRDYAYSQYPRVDVTIDAGGTKIDYSFTLSAQSNAMTDGTGYAHVSLSAAAYREGEITLEGKKRRVALIDFNSNGRFDDEIKIRDDVRGADGVVYPAFGDVLMLDPESIAREQNVYFNPYDVTSGGNRYYVSKLVNIDGRYYDVKVTPAGDKLTLTPAAASLGYVTNPNDGFCAVLYGEKGFVKIIGGTPGGYPAPVPLPEGDWKLLSYTIDPTAMPESKTRPDEKKEMPAGAKKGAEKPKPSPVMSALMKALTEAAGPAMTMPAGRLRLTRVSASATGECQPVQVRKGQTVALPFGPPYKPVVRVDGNMGAGQVRLGMSLIGSAGERCTDMMVGGSRPPNPQFTISDPKGEIVQRGQFEYG
jgi:hypothetical protein